MIENPALFMADFAEPVNLAGALLPHGGIFDRAYRTASVESFGIEGANPSVLCVDVDLGVADHHDDTAIIRGVSYLVVGVEPDGNGYTRLQLRKI